MLIRVRVVPNSRIRSVQMTGTDSYKVKVMEKAIEGKANSAAIEALSSYFNVKKADVVIIKGHASRDKLVEIGSTAAVPAK